ncbi:hypothetical protein AJ79_04693 [Helicocarpus griseus UAMH5409]|uniref:HhH-GPD domain-containing protein n=1 Tax=Helicocarpus griseus UAMH5409 TaxID=1447875 RepID=A0A2B7XT20_9EURO|nr:hypothetical protein AJ79_04693 [Helicocarpus griseus UAMH5409]
MAKQKGKQKSKEKSKQATLTIKQVKRGLEKVAVALEAKQKLGLLSESDSSSTSDSSELSSSSSSSDGETGGAAAVKKKDKKRGTLVEKRRRVGKGGRAAVPVAMKKPRMTKTGLKRPKAAAEVKTKTEPGSHLKRPCHLTPGVTPYPDWAAPTPKQCEEVNALLSSVHGKVEIPELIPEPSLTVSGCGEVPSVLDALLRTLLSGATTSTKAGLALQGLVGKFGVLQEGVGKGSVDWDKVRRAPMEEVYEAIKVGGLAKTKSQHIKKILDMVYEEGLKRRKELMAAEKGGEKDAFRDLEGERDTSVDGGGMVKFDTTGQTILSLEYIRALPKDEAMIELTKFPGVGVKTGACVALFCLQLACFAVDTHVFRLCRWLGWLPRQEEEKDELEYDDGEAVKKRGEDSKSSGKKQGKKPTPYVDEKQAYRHLEVRVPDHLKYSLHQLFIMHGKDCRKCKASTMDGGVEDAGDLEETGACVIEHLVRRTGGKKRSRHGNVKGKGKGKEKIKGVMN